MNQCALIDPTEAAALLEAMADRAGPMTDVLGAVVAQVKRPADEENPAAARPSKAWKPDLRYRSLVERLPVVTFMASLNESVQELYISPQIEALLGFTQEEWLNDPFLWFRQLHVDDRDSWITEFAETCANGKTFRAEYRVLARDGHVVWVQGECQLIRDDEGRPQFLQGVAFDITHLKRAAQVEEARHAAVADSKAKSEFLARMSHEIRTPLNGVVGMIDLMLATEMTDLQRRYTALARDAADSLMLVINDILDFSKIEAGKVEIESVEFDLYAVVEDLTELLAPMAWRKGLSLTCSLRPQIPRKVAGDPNRLRQVLTNLVNNAMKFTAEGSVDIHADLQSVEDGSLVVRFQVHDTGIGIPADRIDRLFESFSQVDSSTTRKFGGTGLGLAISKRLVGLMGGEMGINSEVGKGSTFWFTLRVGAISQAAIEDLAGAIRAVRLLAVEGDERARQFLARQIDGRFSSESRAVTPAEALETLQVAAGLGEPFTVTLIPYGTAEGENLKSDMQRSEDLKDIQLIALTDADDPTEPEVFSQAGFAGVLRRPLTQSRLLDVIATRAVQCFIDTHTAPAPVQSQASVGGLHFLVAEDNEMNQFVTRETLRLRGCTCEIVGDGAQAVEAVRTGKFDAVLMDCQMPGMDGLEASRRIRQYEALSGATHLPIIALTAEAIEGDREKCLASGMDGYVTKPIDAEELFSTIISVINSPGWMKNHCDAFIPQALGELRKAELPTADVLKKGSVMQVLIVDDDEFALSVLSQTLLHMGFASVSARDGREAMAILQQGETRLVITDWDMPEMNGVELCRSIRREDLSGYVYIIMLTGREALKQRMEGLCAGADDFLNKPLDPEELLVCLKTAERILSLETRDLALFALAKLAESRDAETGAHVERVQGYARLLARNLSPQVKAHEGVDEEFLRLLYQTSPLHDLGKVGIPDSILLKPGRLTSDEMAIMQTHTIIGAQTLEAALQRFPNARFLQMARDIAATHHEKFDGSGYPLGLVGQQIPLCGRIVAAADVYDALTSRRVYKEAMNHEDARAVLLQERGRHFDPHVIDAFLLAETQILETWSRLRDRADGHAPRVTVPAPPPPDAGGPAPSRVLVAEDDPVLLARLTELLTAAGQTVYAASNGAEAIAAWSQYAPGVVIADWMMPQVDGLELCRFIRSRSGAAPVHFIMLTAHAEKSRLLEAYNAGVDDFVSKPFDAEELLARVRAGLRTAKLHEELTRKALGSQALNAQLATVNSRLERLSITDELTGMFNRRHAMFRLDEQWALSERYDRPLTIAMIDIDHFKRINDTYGHDAGDAILRQVGQIIRDQTRATDPVCRVGGEEFLVIFPLQTVEEAMLCAQRVRQAIEQAVFTALGRELRVTISVGLGAGQRGIAQFTDLLRVADQGLYAAKRSGRNTIRVATLADAAAVLAAPRGVAKPSAASHPAIDTPPIDMATVLKRCGGDAKFAAAVTDRFKSQALVEVGRIEQALAAGDAATLARLAHGLKSMAAYMASEIACDLARQIESLAHGNRLVEVKPLSVSLCAETERAVEWIKRNAGTPAKVA